MSKAKHRTKTPEQKTKVILRALAPVGAPREPESKRYSLSLMGINEILSDRGGEINAG